MMLYMNICSTAMAKRLFRRAGEPAWLLDTVSTDKRIVGRHAQAMYACPEKEFGYE